MKISDCASLSKKILIKSKNEIKKSTIILTLVILFSLITLLISNSIDKTIESYRTKNSFRTILVSNDFFEKEDILIEKLNQVEDIEAVYTDKSFRSGVDVIDNIKNNTDHSLYLEAAENDLSPEVIAGKKLSSKIDKELICPNKIIFDSDIETNFNLTSADYIDGYRLLNKELIIQYKSFDYSQSIPKPTQIYKEKYKIVGIFDSEIYGNLNTCYTHSNNIININRKVFEGDESLEHSYPSLIAIVNKQENVEKVVNKLNMMGHNTSLMERFNPIINYLGKICNTISIFLLICCMLLINIIIKKEKEENKQNEQVFFYLGYNKKEIFMINTIKNILYITSIFLIVMIILNIMYIIAYYIIKYKYIVLSIFKIEYPIMQILLIYIIIILFIVINNIFCKLEREK